MTIDRTGWPSGPWDDEPDREQWEAHGVTCLALRDPRLGFWCGYIAVLAGHPWHGLTALWVPHPDAEWTGVPSERRDVGSADAWFIGFDCNHLMDATPVGGRNELGATYCTLATVRAQCESLAKAAQEVDDD